MKAVALQDEEREKLQGRSAVWGKNLAHPQDK